MLGKLVWFMLRDPDIEARDGTDMRRQALACQLGVHMHMTLYVNMLRQMFELWCCSALY